MRNVICYLNFYAGGIKISSTGDVEAFRRCKFFYFDYWIIFCWIAVHHGFLSEGRLAVMLDSPSFSFLSMTLHLKECTSDSLR